MTIALSASDSVSAAKESKRSKSRIFVVEDNGFVREALITLIAGQNDFSCCGQAGTLEGMQSGVERERPDLLLTDLRLKDGETFEVITLLKARFPAMGILVISHCDEMLYAERAVQAGASGYLMKVEASEELLTAARTVLNGKVYLSHAMSVRLVQRVLKPGLSSAPVQKGNGVKDQPPPARTTEPSGRSSKVRRKIS